MRYADTLLADGERIVYRTRQHPLAVVIEGRTALLLVVAALALIVVQAWSGATGTARDVLGLLALALLVVGLLWLLEVYWRWRAEDYMITTRRVLKVEGILNKRSADSSLEKINDAVLTQNLGGRMLGYGNLEIMTAAEEAVDVYRMLEHAPEFKRTMLNQKHALETEYVRPGLPTPPLRASAAQPVAQPQFAQPPVAQPAAQVAQPASPPPTRPPAPPERPQMTPDEVTATLSKLADLRDRGAITPEEYEAKKVELLARL